MFIALDLLQEILQGGIIGNTGIIEDLRPKDFHVVSAHSSCPHRGFELTSSRRKAL
jgi:hypothetical protein